MKKLMKRFLQVSPVVTTLAYAKPAFAQAWDAFIPPYLIGFGGGSVVTLVQRIINILILIAGVVAIIYLIVAGYQYITAGGNAEQATVARTGILNAVIGIIVIFASYLLVNFLFYRLQGGV